MAASLRAVTSLRVATASLRPGRSVLRLVMGGLLAVDKNLLLLVETLSKAGRLCVDIGSTYTAS